MKSFRFITLLAVILLLTSFAVDAQSIEKAAPVEYLKLTPGAENDRIKAGIAEILKENVEIEDVLTEQTGNPTNILVLDDRIEFTVKNKIRALYYYQLLDKPIETEQPKIKFYLRAANFKFYSHSLARKNTDGVFLLRAYLISIQTQIKKKQYDYQLTLFKPVASTYLASKIKTPISEEQRKYIVQANMLSQKMDYQSAIDIYNKAIDVDPTSYPAAYSNMALLCAQIKNYIGAIYYMNKYLMLEPEATDSRGAQDKIYEWELIIQK